MALTRSSVLTALSTAINADPVLVTAKGNKDYQAIADAMNAPSSPAVQLWRPTISTTEILGAVLASDMTTISQGNLGYMQMLLTVGSVDGTNANVRSNFGTIFSGKSTLTNLTGVAQRQATRFEALSNFTTLAGAASVSTAFGYNVSAQDVRDAFGL